MQVHIRYLADVPQYVPIIAQWLYDEWNPHDPTLMINEITEMLLNRLNKTKIPLALIAVEADKPVGIIGLKDNVELNGYTDRKTWIAHLYVVAEYRAQGIGSILLKTACDKARKFGCAKVSLFTIIPESNQWYMHLNWKKFGQDTYQGMEATLWEFEL